MTRKHSPDCRPSCREVGHGNLITAAIIRGSEEEAIAYMRSLCQRCCFVTDSTGKSPLHTAVSCGKKKIVRWLLANGVSVNQKDQESGYTPLHRAVFYGQLHIVNILLKAGASLKVLDKDSLSPLDHIMLDRPWGTLPRLCDDTKDEDDSLQQQSREIYVWGSNNNYNLGQANQQSREIPEFVDSLHRCNISISSVSLNKFHTLFLTSKGEVYTCGHGQGGRLGLDTDSPVIVPQRLKTLNNFIITAIATGVDHTIILTKCGQVWSCGINRYHQLGLINPSPEYQAIPRQVSLHKSQKELVFLGIGAGKYHSVIWTSKTLYTFGLNGGQLGHHKNINEKTISSPRQVTSLVLRDNAVITCIGVSDGATVIATSQGNIYVLHQYQTRQVASNISGIIKVACNGGYLDFKAGEGPGNDDKRQDLKIVVLSKHGYLFLWTEQVGHLTRCMFNLAREILVSDVCINNQKLAIVSTEGEAFYGAFTEPTQSEVNNKLDATKINYFDFIDKRSCTIIKLSRISALHRTVSIFCDPKGLNFAALQLPCQSFLNEYPIIGNSSMVMDLKQLYEETCESDFLHDTIISTDTRNFPAHSYIIAYECDYFRKLIKQSSYCTENVVDMESCIVPKYNLFINDISNDLLQEILIFLYTNKCKIIDLVSNNSSIDNPVINNDNLKQHRRSYDVYKQLNTETTHQAKLSGNNKNNKTKKRNLNTDYTTRKASTVSEGKKKTPVDIMKTFARTVKKLGISKLDDAINGNQLLKLCQDLKMNEPRTHIECDDRKSFVFSRINYPGLYDVQLCSEDNQTISAHKVILAARLEYFHAMFCSGWIETTTKETIQMPFPHNILKIIIDYLYEDDSPELYITNDLDLVCDVLVIADQLLIIRLKDICQVALARLVNLKNVINLLQFSVNYLADQLKASIMQFICLNLAVLIENGSLQTLCSERLEDMTIYYKSFVPRMACRILTPFESGPSNDILSEVLKDNPITLPQSDEEWNDQTIADQLHVTTTNSSTRRKKRCSRNEGRSRKASTSSQFSSTSEGDQTRELEQQFESLNFDDLKDLSLTNSEIIDSVVIQDNDSLCNNNNNNTMDGHIELMSSNTLSIKADNHWVCVGKQKHSLGSDADSDKHEILHQTTTPFSTLPLDHSIKLTSSTTLYNNQTKSPSSTTAKKLFQSETMIVKNQCTTQQAQQFPSLISASSTFSSPLDKYDNTVKPKTNKLSQKQRKKLAADAAAGSTPDKSQQPPRAWGIRTIEDCNDGRKSLVDIMKLEEENVLSDPPVIVTTQSPPRIKKDCTLSSNTWMREVPLDQMNYRSSSSNYETCLQSSNERPSLTEISSTVHPWSLKPSPNFSLILQEEEKQSQNLKKERMKPLTFIQLEDCAIEELLQYYSAMDNPEERITITRVKNQVANITWIK